MKSMFKKVLFYFLSFVLLLCIIEVLLGLSFMYKDRNIEPENVKDFPYLYFLFDHTKGAYNEHGFKTSYTIEKPVDVYRIILTGGSVARGKEPEKSIAAFLERELQLNFPGKKIQVINAGVSAYGVQQEFLLLQMILQFYKPDMMVSLDGYNDMLTFKLNRFYDSGYALPPHHWKDFRIIRDKTFQNKWYGRFALPFKNINRTKDYFIRTAMEKKYDWNFVTDSVAASHALAYNHVVQDHFDFCKSKSVVYVNFLQPIKFYNADARALTPEKAALLKIYHQFESYYSGNHTNYSLAGLLNHHKNLFTDDCHVTAEGNEKIAQAMADVLKEKIKNTDTQSEGELIQ